MLVIETILVEAFIVLDKYRETVFERQSLFLIKTEKDYVILVF